MRAIIFALICALLLGLCCGCDGDCCPPADNGGTSQAQPGDEKAAPVVPEGMALLRSETGGCRLFVPDTWQRHVPDEGTKFAEADVIAEASASFTEDGYNEPTARISVQVVKLAEDTDLKKFAAEKAKWFEDTWSANDGMQTREIEIDGIKCVEHSMKHLTRAGGADFARLIVGVKGGYAYVIHTRRADASAEYDEVIDEIVKSFKFIKMPQPPANKGE